MFTTVQNLITALQQSTTPAASQAQLNNSISGAIDNIDQALGNMQNVQATSARG